MKNAVLIVAMVLSGFAFAAAGPNSTDYKLNVHVASSRLTDQGRLRINVVIDGKKYELEGLDGEIPLLMPGDYKAREVQVRRKDAHPYDLQANYEFVFSDNKTRRFNLVGVTE